jgi:hypothetical protein
MSSTSSSEEIEQANDILQSKNVSIETINEHVKLNEKLSIIYLFKI